MTHRRTGGTLAVLAAMLLACSTSLAAPAARAADCEFLFGFKALHDLIPNTVGDCVSDEEHNPENGDGLQQTTNGLMVWRKADNWTAFTDGSMTWINGPSGLQSRSNNDRFPWEAVAQPSQPSTPASPPASAPAPVPTATPTPPPAPVAQSGPIQRDPAEIALGPADMGKEITQVYLKTGSDDRGRWAEIRFYRDIELTGQGLGPNKIVNRVYVAKDVSAAQAIYKDEVSKQSKMPEAEDALGAVYVNDGKIPKNTVQNVGDEQDSRAGCNDDCTTSKFDHLHQRTVMRYQNAVTVVYFWGSDSAATTKQMDEWLGKVRGRMG
ncbi:MAG: hypothetical protein IT307_16175 [Chloroflexi bacterium]|nr:hypothetical protein [Chloroflexota bacterium]